MNRLNRLIESVLANPEVLRAARAQRVLRQWDRAVGEAMAERSWPDRFERGTAWVAVEGSAWAQELRLRKRQILARLNEMADEPNLFQDLRFGVRKVYRKVDPIETLPRKQPRPPDEGLTIREIAQRRLRKMADANPD